MDVQKALEAVAKLHLEKNQFHAKKIKAKKKAIVTLIIGLIFLVPFIVFAVLTSLNYRFSSGIALIIIFGVFSLIFLEASIVYFVLMKCVYGYQEENRRKILEIINKEVNKNKASTNE